MINIYKFISKFNIYEFNIDRQNFANPEIKLRKKRKLKFIASIKAFRFLKMIKKTQKSLIDEIQSSSNRYQH